MYLLLLFFVGFFSVLAENGEGIGLFWVLFLLNKLEFLEENENLVKGLEFNEFKIELLIFLSKLNEVFVVFSDGFVFFLDIVFSFFVDVFFVLLL